MAMAKFLIVFYGGKMETDPAKQKKSMDTWMAWYKQLGKAVVDMGTPTMPGKIINAAGMQAIGDRPVTGYSIIQAESMDAALALAKGCPIIADGGQVAVYSMMAMM